MKRPCLFLLLLICSSFLRTRGFSVKRYQLPGIWKLVAEGETTLLHQDVRSAIQRAWDASNASDDESKKEIFIQLNPDGSFLQRSESAWLLAGSWDLVENERLVLAVDRWENAGTDCVDILYEGRFDRQDKVKGQVLTGKFTYPKNHPMFFDQPLMRPKATGAFCLTQAVATASISSSANETPPKRELINKQEFFYDKKFYMTIEPVQTRRDEAADELQLPIDIRAMPIQFFRNNTFEALGTNKILRGHFGITEQDELWFQVSLFGSGRSMRGSVYSEGIGLGQDDKRSYTGEILKEGSDRLLVAGSVTVGSDFGSDARPEPVGTFLLKQTDEDGSNSNLDEDEEEAKNSAFE